MKIALYARVSTSDKDQNPNNQLLPLQQLCQTRGWEIVQKYVDTESGANESRPELNQMLKDAEQGKFKVVMTWKLDRLSRNLRNLLNALYRLKEWNVDFICLSQQIDTTTSAGKLQLHMLGAFAEFERDLIAERVRAGIERRKAEGKPIGRASLSVKLTRIGVPETIRTLRGQGLSIRQIAEHVKYRDKRGIEHHASKSFVHKILSQDASVKNTNVSCP